MVELIIAYGSAAVLVTLVWVNGYFIGRRNQQLTRTDIAVQRIAAGLISDFEWSHADENRGPAAFKSRREVIIAAYEYADELERQRAIDGL
jgi:hypothetical protein